MFDEEKTGVGKVEWEYDKLDLFWPSGEYVDGVKVLIRERNINVINNEWAIYSASWGEEVTHRLKPNNGSI